MIKRCLNDKRLIILSVLILVLVSIQVAFYPSISNRSYHYYSLEFPEESHNLTSTEEIYNIFINYENWETESYLISTSNEDILWVKLTNNETNTILRLNSEKELMLRMDFDNPYFIYETKGPPLHPRSVSSFRESEGFNEYENQKRSYVCEILFTLDIDADCDSIDIGYCDFFPFIEEPGGILYMLSYFLLFLITATISAISKNPLIPTDTGKNHNLFFTSLWYIGMALFFFFISIIIMRFYHNTPNKLFFIPGIVGSLSMISGFTLNYFKHIKNGEKKVDDMGIHVIENNESCTYDREEPPKW